MATTFPTLTGKPANPVVTSFSDQLAFDPTIKSPKAAGYVKTRARFTRNTRKYHVVYNGIDTTDKDLIKAHETERGVGGNYFTWTNPADSISKTVRLATPVSCRPWEETNYTKWIVEFDLEEV